MIEEEHIVVIVRTQLLQLLTPKVHPMQLLSTY